MALLTRFVRIGDRFNTHVFTFVVTRSVTRDLHRDVTSKEFSYGYHRWVFVTINLPRKKENTREQYRYHLTATQHKTTQPNLAELEKKTFSGHLERSTSSKLLEIKKCKKIH